MKKIVIFAAILLICLSCPSFSQETDTAAEKTGTISLDLKNAPLRSVLYALGNEAGLNIVTGPWIKGSVTISVKNVTPADALAAVLKSSGYAYKTDGNVIRILTSPSQKLSGEEISKENGLLTRAFVLNNIAAEDIKEMLTKLDYKDSKVLSAKGSNVLVVEAPRPALLKIDKLIKKLDIAPNQVLVESQIMEITAGNAATPSILGIKGKYTSSAITPQTEGFAKPATTGIPGFYAHVVRGNAEAYVEMLEHREGFNLLANPKVIAVSGKAANIISGSKLGYKTTLTTTTGTSQNIDFLEVGTKLSFTPYISTDGSIRMDIHPEVSEGTITTDGLPQKQTTEATTTVIVRDGETIIIGGLIKSKSSEVENGVPVVMNIPFFGNFFKKKERLWEKKEIIAMLTPHLITAEKIKQMTSEINLLRQKQKGSNIGEAPDIMWWMK